MAMLGVSRAASSLSPCSPFFEGPASIGCVLSGVLRNTHCCAAATCPAHAPASCFLSAVNNLSKSKVKAMRKQALQDLCDTLGIDVEGCKVKNDYITKVLAYVEQQRGTQQPHQADAEAAPAAPKVRQKLSEYRQHTWAYD